MEIIIIDLFLQYCLICYQIIIAIFTLVIYVILIDNEYKMYIKNTIHKDLIERRKNNIYIFKLEKTYVGFILIMIIEDLILSPLMPMYIIYEFIKKKIK